MHQLPFLGYFGPANSFHEQFLVEHIPPSGRCYMQFLVPVYHLDVSLSLFSWRADVSLSLFSWRASAGTVLALQF